MLRMRVPSTQGLYPVYAHATDKRGVDVVIENVGAATWKESIRPLKGGGRLVSCDSTSGPVARRSFPRVLEAGAPQHRHRWSIR